MINIAIILGFKTIEPVFCGTLLEPNEWISLVRS